jgi:hypothetical protein
MAFAEVGGGRALREIQNSNDRIREDFLLRTRLLEAFATTSTCRARIYAATFWSGKPARR